MRIAPEVRVTISLRLADRARIHPAHRQPACQRLKFATLTSRIRAHCHAGWLEKEKPEGACLQELKSVDAGFPIDEIHAAGYGAVWKGQSAWNGVAVLARGVDPVESRRVLPGDPADEQSRYLEVVAHGLVVACLYLPNGNPQPGSKFDYKLKWFDRFIDHAAQLYKSGHPVVLRADSRWSRPIQSTIHNLAQGSLRNRNRARYALSGACGWIPSPPASRRTHHTCRITSASKGRGQVRSRPPLLNDALLAPAPVAWTAGSDSQCQRPAPTDHPVLRAYSRRGGKQ